MRTRISSRNCLDRPGPSGRALGDLSRRSALGQPHRPQPRHPRLGTVGPGPIRLRHRHPVVPQPDRARNRGHDQAPLHPHARLTRRASRTAPRDRTHAQPHTHGRLHRPGHTAAPACRRDPRPLSLSVRRGGAVSACSTTGAQVSGSIIASMTTRAQSRRSGRRTDPVPVSWNADGWVLRLVDAPTEWVPRSKGAPVPGVPRSPACRITP